MNRIVNRDNVIHVQSVGVTSTGISPVASKMPFWNMLLMARISTPCLSAFLRASVKAGSVFWFGLNAPESGRWIKKSMRVLNPLLRALISSRTWRVPRRVGASGNNARPFSTKVQDLASAKHSSLLLRRKSNRLLPHEASFLMVL